MSSDSGEYLYDRMDRNRKKMKDSDLKFMSDCEGWNGEVGDGPKYKGILGSVKNHQRLLNMSMTSMIGIIEYTEEFEEWFKYQSFSCVPKFCKPLIKGWVKHSFMAGKGVYK